MAMGIGYSTGAYAAGKITDSLGVRKLLGIAGFAVCLCSLSNTFFLLNAWLSGLLLFFWSVGMGMGANGINLIMSEVEGGVRGTLFSLRGVIVQFSIFLSSLSSGMIFNATGSFRGIGLVIAGACILVLFLEKRAHLTRLSMPRDP